MDHDLGKEAEQGNIDALYELFTDQPLVLDELEKKSFVDTPFHIAASHGKLHFAIEMMMLKPSFGRKLNQDGYTPMHLAIQNGHDELVRAIFTKDEDLIRVSGTKGMTPMHCLVLREEKTAQSITLLRDILFSCPNSLEDLTVERETAFHLAVKNNKFEEFKILVECIQKFHKEDIYGWKDEEGYTALHHATRGSKIEMILFLFQKYRYKEWNLKVEVQDDQNWTAVDIAKDLPEENENKNKIIKLLMLGIRQGVTTRQRNGGSWFPFRDLRYINHQVSESVRKMPRDSQETLLLVLTLVVTTTFMVGVSPPGGCWQDNGKKEDTPGNAVLATTNPAGKKEDLHTPGNAILATTNPALYCFISFFTMAGFASSLNLIMLLTMGMPMKNLLIVATTSLACSYFVAFIAITSKYIWVIATSYALVLILLGVTFLLYARKFMKKRALPLHSDVIHVKTL